MKNFSKIFVFVLSFAILLWLESCATVQAPSGGAKDTTQPEVLVLKPANFSTNFQGKEIEFEFNRYLNKTSLVDNLNITPSIKYRPVWSGRDLTLEFLDTLQPNTTYSIQIGTDYTDFLGNKPKQSLNAIFSTGSQIDSGGVSGHIEVEKNPTLYAFAYRVDGNRGDTLNIGKTPPDYKVPIGSNGDFSIVGLKAGKYRIFAIGDKQKDGVFNFNTDEYASAVEDYQIGNTITPKLNLILGKAVDNTPPRVQSLTSQNETSVILEFSEEIDSLSLSVSAFKFTSLKGNKEISIQDYKFLGANNKIQVYSNSEFAKDEEYRLDYDSTKAIKDFAGNLLDKPSGITFFSTNSIKDSLPLLKQLLPNDSSTMAFGNVIKLELNRPLAKEKITFKLTQMGVEKALDLKQKDNSIYYFSLPNGWEENSKYEFNIKFKDDKKDSLIEKTIKFKTIAKEIGSNISGIIQNVPDCKGKLLLNFKTGDKKVITTEVKSGVFSLENVQPAEYKMDCFCDENANGKLDYGYPFPFRFAEKSYLIDGTIKPKARWDLNDVKLIVKE